MLWKTRQKDGILGQSILKKSCPDKLFLTGRGKRIIVVRTNEVSVKEDIHNMNKQELVAEMVAQTNLTKKDVEAVLNSFIDVVTKELKVGEKVQLVGFGTFDVAERAARVGRNPSTKEEIQIPASKAPRFKAGKALKDAVKD